MSYERNIILEKSQLIKQLYDIGAIKVGSFTLKSGVISPIYIDLRQIISYPVLLKAVAQRIWEKVKHLSDDLLCGVPYTALPIATCIAIEHNKPMIMVRKEAKNYGTRQMVEGSYQAGQSVLVIEDVVTSGASILNTVQELQNVGLQVTHVAAFLDREQGGKDNLAKNACEFFHVITLTEIFTELAKLGISLPSERL